MDFILDQVLLESADKLPLTALANYTLSCIMYSMYTLPLLLVCLALMRPDLLDFWTSLFPHPGELWLPERVILAILQGHFLLLICDLGLLMIASGFPFLFVVLDLLRAMR